MSNIKVMAAEKLVKALKLTTKQEDVSEKAKSLYKMANHQKSEKEFEVARVYLSALTDPIYAGLKEQSEAIYELYTDEYNREFDRENAIKQLALNYYKNGHDVSKTFLDENVSNWRDIAPNPAGKVVNTERAKDIYTVYVNQKFYNAILFKGYIVTVMELSECRAVVKVAKNEGSTIRYINCTLSISEPIGNTLALTVLKPEENLGEGIKDFSTRQLYIGEKLNSIWYFYTNKILTASHSEMMVSNVEGANLIVNQSVRMGEQGAPLFDTDGKLVAIKTEPVLTGVEVLDGNVDYSNVKVSASGMGKAISLSKIEELIKKL